jgi:hypothetical protein
MNSLLKPISIVSVRQERKEDFRENPYFIELLDKSNYLRVGYIVIIKGSPFRLFSRAPSWAAAGDPPALCVLESTERLEEIDFTNETQCYVEHTTNGEI